MAKKTVWLPYDFDTAIGINNEGALAFSYDLEDIDTVNGADVYNGQNSVLWENVRAAYASELKEMYQELRSTGKLSYEVVEQMFEEHQSKWSEAIFNEDAQFKYIDPLINDNDAAYLSMLQGSKAEQRKWWLWNRFRYLDSKYNAGDALTQVITLRGYVPQGETVPSITVTPYASIYATIKYGSYLVQDRAARNVPVTLTNPLDRVNDTEIYIYSADQLADIGDISGLKVGYANFTYATKLISLKIGDSSPNYSNPNLGAHQSPALVLGNNTLLRSLDVRNCPNLAESVDISGCTNIEEVYFDGTSITGVVLPNGGVLKTLHLPDTVTSLRIQNQPNLTSLVLENPSTLTTLVLENAGTVDSYSLVTQMATGGRIRIIGFEWTVDSGEEVLAVLSQSRGIDASGRSVDTPQLSGTINITGEITTAQLDYLRSAYTNVVVNYTTLRKNIFYKYVDGTLIDGTDGIFDGITTQWKGYQKFLDKSVIWLPNVSSIGGGLTLAAWAIYLGIGKQGDTDVIPMTKATFAGVASKSNIYVPDNLVDAYKEATNWSSYASRIYPLSEAPYEYWNGGVLQ